MTKQEFRSYMERQFEKLRATSASGQAEYAHGQDAFDNFKRLAGMLNLEKEEVLFVYMQKHLDGIASWIKGHRSQREPVQGRIDDAMVYLLLLRAMADEEEGLTKEVPMPPLASLIPPPRVQ